MLTTKGGDGPFTLNAIAATRDVALAAEGNSAQPVASFLWRNGAR